jgi:hypothetical protein
MDRFRDRAANAQGFGKIIHRRLSITHLQLQVRAVQKCCCVLRIVADGLVKISDCHMPVGIQRPRHTTQVISFGIFIVAAQQAA